MKNNEIVRALRCISTAGGENACEHCPYWKEEEVPEEERPIYGADTMHSCDVDRVGLDGADLIERLTARCARYAEEIAVAQERTRWIPVTERLPEATDGGYVLACVTWKDAHIDYQNAVVMAFVSEKGLVDVEMDCVLDGVTHWMPLPEGPEEEG
jgi:hypothetical protein|nr:MAG TPA: Protein of unknown function (DUF551) [Caudoviricetes sp.]